jgi:hypothetical protein
MGNTSPRPGIILVPVSTELLADQGEWSGPVRVMFSEQAGEWEMVIEEIPDPADLRQQAQDLAHRLDHLDTISGDPPGVLASTLVLVRVGELDEIRQALHRLARGGA